MPAGVKEEVGSIDVLLLSSQGRIALVETKLAANPELRRSVLAQTLDYLAHLSDRFDRELPEIPRDQSGQPVAAAEDNLESVAEGDVLVIIASDDIHPRAARLSRTLLSDHLVSPWDLALVDVSLYRPLDGSRNFVVVPHLRNVNGCHPHHTAAALAVVLGDLRKVPDPGRRQRREARVARCAAVMKDWL